MKEGWGCIPQWQNTLPCMYEALGCILKERRRKEGKKKGRKEGRKDGRQKEKGKEGRKEGLICLS